MPQLNCARPPIRNGDGKIDMQSHKRISKVREMTRVEQTFATGTNSDGDNPKNILQEIAPLLTDPDIL